MDTTPPGEVQSRGSTEKAPSPQALREQIRLNRESIQSLISRTSSLRLKVNASVSAPSTFGAGGEPRRKGLASVFDLGRGSVSSLASGGSGGGGGLGGDGLSAGHELEALRRENERLKADLAAAQRAHVELAEDLDETVQVLRRVTAHHQQQHATDPSKELLAAIAQEKARSRELQLENWALKQKVNKILNMVAEAAACPAGDDDDDGALAEVRKENLLLRSMLLSK